MSNELRAAIVAGIVAMLVLVVAERRWASWRKRVWQDVQTRTER